MCACICEEALFGPVQKELLRQTRTDSREKYTHLLVPWLKTCSLYSIGQHAGTISVRAHLLGEEHKAALKSKFIY